MCLPHTGFDMGNMAGVLQEAEVCYSYEAPESTPVFGGVHVVHMFLLSVVFVLFWSYLHCSPSSSVVLVLSTLFSEFISCFGLIYIVLRVHQLFWSYLHCSPSSSVVLVLSTLFSEFISCFGLIYIVLRVHQLFWISTLLSIFLT